MIETSVTYVSAQTRLNVVRIERRRDEQRHHDRGQRAEDEEQHEQRADAADQDLEQERRPVAAADVLVERVAPREMHGHARRAPPRGSRRRTCLICSVDVNVGLPGG